MSLLIALWFASGIIMMYVEYPELTEAERIEMLPAIPWQHVVLDPATAASTVGAMGYTALKLTTVLGRPAYQFRHGPSWTTTVFADTGELLEGSLTPAEAERAVALSGFNPEGSLPRYVETIEMDQWTVSAGLSPHRPLHKVAIGDTAGTIVYVSDTTGQIVRDTHRRERFWNWIGSTIHWIYPWQLRRHVELWVDVIIYLSLAGLASIASGMLVGWWRLRIRHPYRGRSVTPYRGMHRWHHLLGVGTALFLLTFMFSGLMSMAPWGVFMNATSAASPLARYTGGQVEQLTDYPALTTIAQPTGLKEVEWLRLNGAPYLLATYSITKKAAVDANGIVAPSELRTRIETAATRLLPDLPVLRKEVLTRYDDYYYSHHNRHRPLPVLRVVYADAEQSWYHLDLTTGQAVNRLTRTDRMARWLYNGLHSFDLAVLFQRRPLWDLVVILLCVAGLVFSVTSVCVGWRRLRSELGIGRRCAVRPKLT